MNDLDLMETKEIMEYLARNRFSRGMVLAGIANGNDTMNVSVTTFIKGKAPEVGIIQEDIAKEIVKRNGEL